MLRKNGCDKECGKGSKNIQLRVPHEDDVSSFVDTTSFTAAYCWRDPAATGVDQRCYAYGAAYD